MAAATKDKKGTKGKATAKPAAKPKAETKPLDTGKTATGKTVEITCAKKGCGVKRTIKVQDKFQVKRCVDHQKEHRNELRKKRRREKAKAAKK